MNSPPLPKQNLPTNKPKYSHEGQWYRPWHPDARIAGVKIVTKQHISCIAHIAFR
jgi:hypothetical protein